MTSRSTQRALAGLVSVLLAHASGPARAAASALSGEATLHHRTAVVRIHAARDQVPVWVDGRVLTPRTLGFLEMLAAADTDGLDPTAYHLDELDRLKTGGQTTPAVWTDFQAMRTAESLLSDAFLALGVHLARGRVEPGAVWEKWPTPAVLPDPLPLLEATLADLPAPGREQPAAIRQTLVQTLDSCRPDRADYRRLRRELARLDGVARAGGWPLVEPGDLLRPGMVDARIPVLRARLHAGGDLPAPWLAIGIPVGAGDDRELFSAELAGALCSFQRRHGLTPDGILGPRTLSALNVQAADRVRQIALNLERWRWLPRDPGERHIQVNIPDFTLALVTDGEPELTMRAIVGRHDRPTPVVSGMMSWLVLNPRWNVPQKLAREDLLPKLTADPAYLADRGFRIFTDWRPGAVEIDPAQVDWPAMVPWDMAYKFQQEPGPRNPLGRIKFLFRNEFSVYIHDTNQRAAFARWPRCFSSGCVRVEDPASLLLALTAPAAGDSAAVAALAEGATLSVGLKQPLPVHLVYLTAWVDQNGVLQFRDDCYGYDTDLAEALAACRIPPAPANPLRAEQEVAVVGELGTAAAVHQVRTGPVSTWTNPGPE